MTSEIRVNKLENRVGLGTIEYSNTGPVITGVTTASNFKTGSSNLHSSGVEVAGVNVLGADTPIGLGATIYNSGAAVFTGVVTATSFSGSGGTVDINGDLDVDGHTNLDNVSIAGVVTATDLTVEKSGNLNVNIKSTSGWGALEVGGATAAYIDIKKPFSADFDLRLMHDGSNSYITSADKPLHFDAYSYKSINIGALGQTDLRYAGNVKLKTETGGISVTGVLTATTFVGALTGTASGNPTLASGSNNRIITATGANALTGESTLTYDNPNLEINTDTSAYAALVLNGNTGGMIQFEDNETSIWEMFGATDFSIYDRANTNQAFTIKSGGSIGINNTNPQEKLQITGNISFGNRSDGGSRYIGKGTNGSGGVIGDASANANSSWIGFVSGSGTGAEDQLRFGTLKSGTSGGERMRITGTGEVGINVTDPTQGKLVVSTSSGNTAVFLKSNNGAAIGLGGASQPRILLEAQPSASDYKIYTAGGSSWNSPSWSEKFQINAAGGIKLSNTAGGHLFAYGGSTVNTVAAIDIYRLGNGYADIRLSSNYGATLRLAGASNNTDEYQITQDNQKNAYHNLQYDGFINFVTNNTTQAMRLQSGKVSINKNIETLTGNGFAAALQVNNKTTDGYGTIMMGGGYNRATIGIGNVYDLILTSNAYPANASTGGIKFRCGNSGGGGPTQRFRIHQDGMLDTRQHGTAKTYWFSSGQSGGYSSLTITIDAHAYHSFVITVAHAGYAGSWTTSKFMGYENGSLYYPNEGTETTDSNSRNATHSHDGGHKHKILITGGMGTHPGCELRLTICGPDAYIDTGDVAFTWS